MLGTQVMTLNNRGVPAAALYSGQASRLTQLIWMVISYLKAFDFNLPFTLFQGKKNRDKVMNDLLGRVGDGAEDGPPLIRLLYVTPEMLCNRSGTSK
jgi:hypothetical protein